MAKASYYELLKHPLWQEKRLQIMRRDGFSCLNCGTKEVTLHVHHTYYERGLDPWDYPSESLHTLCEDCHVIEQEEMTALHRAIGLLSLTDARRLRGFAMGLRAAEYPNEPMAVNDPEVAEGMGAAWGFPGDLIVTVVLESGIIDGRVLAMGSERVQASDLVERNGTYLKWKGRDPKKTAAEDVKEELH